MKILGIDIEVRGAVAILDEAGKLVEHACPANGPSGRQTISAALLAGIIRETHAVCRAFVEHVSARPGEAVTGAFAFGRSRGVIEGVLGALEIRVAFITPASWKRALGLSGASKDAARGEAIRRWPEHAAMFARVKDDGRAEAALIAVAGTGGDLSMFRCSCTPDQGG